MTELDRQILEFVSHSVKFTTLVIFYFRDEVYYIPCDSKAQDILIFFDDKKSYTIKAKELIVDAGNGKCYWAFFPMGEGDGYNPNWIFGDPFIRSYCHVFDLGQQRVGLAQSLVNN